MSAAWILPVVALLLAAWLAYQGWVERGYVVTIQFDQGHGLKAGDDVRYRGIAVGRVREVTLTSDHSGILVRAALDAESSDLARLGTRFWVVRPEVGVTNVAGLETIVGPRYVALIPGDGPERRQFVGLREPPVVERFDPGDLEIVLTASPKGSLRARAPVLYRQVQIGTILSVGLSGDGGAVEARVHIPKAYTQLIRPETKFWSVGGLEAQVGIRGFSIDVDSLASLISGGVSLATPPLSGDVVHNGHRFELEQEPRKDWLDWQPLVAIGSHLLPRGARMPTPMRAVLDWEQGKWLKSEQSNRGWVLQLEEGLLGPADLLTIAENAQNESVVLEVAGQPIQLAGEPIWKNQHLALIDFQVNNDPWPTLLRRSAEEPEECLAIGDAPAGPLPLSITRLFVSEDTWQIDPALAIDESWHGAAIVARSDGRLIGMLIIKEDGALVAQVKQTYQKRDAAE